MGGPRTRVILGVERGYGWKGDYLSVRSLERSGCRGTPLLQEKYFLWCDQRYPGLEPDRGGGRR